MRVWFASCVLLVGAACSNQLEPLFQGEGDVVPEGDVGSVDDPDVDDPKPPDPPPDGDQPPSDDPNDPPPPPPPPDDEDPPPPPTDGGDDFGDAAPIACGQLIEGTVASTPKWYRLDTTGRNVTLTLHGSGSGDIDLHVTDGPNIPGDVLAVSESPTAHEEVEVSDQGVVGVRVLLYGGASAMSFTLTVECAPIGTTPPGGGDPTPPGEPPPDLDCIQFDEENSRNVTGSALRDIVQHLPDDQVDYYCDPDLVTCAHEVSHGIHAHLRNYFNPNNERSNAFYILQDRACFVVEPGIWKHEVAPFVPNALREFRYGTYVSGQQAWDDTPLYIWDEWNAYINGGEAAISMYDEGVWNDGWRDQSGVIEFVAYGVAVGLAVEDNDPTYFTNNGQFKAMMAYMIRRSLELHRRFATIADFQFDTSDNLYSTLRTAAAGAPLRDFILRTYGQQFHDEVLDL